MVPEAPLRIGRYVLYEGLATGSTSTVHFGIAEGEGFARIVAIKRFLPNLAASAEFVAELSAEVQRIVRVRHLNIVGVREIVTEVGECIVTMDYVPGETLGVLLAAASARPDKPPAPVICAVMRDVLQGLHAVHEARDPEGAALGLVHGDVSPNNILVGSDGFSRLLDFGVAHALGDLSLLQRDHVRGKLSYTAPERIQTGDVDARADIFALSISFWESLVGQRLFLGDDAATTLENVGAMVVQRPSELVPSIPKALDEVVMRGLDRDAARRFKTAKEMAAAIQAALRPATLADVEAWMKELAGDALAARVDTAKAVEHVAQKSLATVESQTASNMAAAPSPGSHASPDALPPVSQRGRSVDMPMEQAPPSSHRELPLPPISQPIMTAPAPEPLPPESFGASSFGPSSFGSAESETFGPRSTSLTANAIKELPPPMRENTAARMHGPKKIFMGAMILCAMYAAVYYLLMTPSDHASASPSASAYASAPAAAPTPSVDPFEQLTAPTPADSSQPPPHITNKPKTGKQHLKRCDPPFVRDMSGRKVPNTSCN